jgi:hypothetical protein
MGSINKRDTHTSRKAVVADASTGMSYRAGMRWAFVVAEGLF